MERTIFSHVAVLGVDGMGSFNKQANTPNFDRIFASGAVTYSALSMNPTISAENWGAMLLGAAPMVHGLTNSIVDQQLYTNKDLPSIFTLIRRKFPDAYLASCCNWNPINYGIIEHDVNVDMHTADRDDDLVPIIIDCVKKEPKFLFVQFDDVDGAGHGCGYGSKDYIKQVEKEDAFVGQVYDAYKNAGILDDTLFIVTADHGGYGHGHGGYTDGEKYVYLAAAGNGIAAGEIEYARTVDIAAIVLHALGVELPPYNPLAFISQVPNGLFPWHKAEYHYPVSVKPADVSAFRHLEAIDDNAELVVDFDDKLADSTGKHDLAELGHVKYYWDENRVACGELGSTGHFKTADKVNLNGSFTLSMWIKTDGSIVDGAYVLGARENDFFIELYLNAFNMNFIMGANGKTIDVTTPIADEYFDAWMHYAVVVDAQKESVTVFHDFEFQHEWGMPEGLADGIVPATIVAGTDPEGKRNISERPCIFRIDDLIISRGTNAPKKPEKE